MASSTFILAAINQDTTDDELYKDYIKYFSAPNQLSYAHYPIDSTITLTKAAAIRVMAKVSAFLTSQHKVMQALKELESEFAVYFKNKVKDVDLDQYFSDLTFYNLQNLTWPYAKNDIKLNAVLDQFLLSRENCHGLNMGGAPKLVGLVSNKIFMEQLSHNFIPREETKINTFLFHGDIHRLQFALLEIAMKNKLIDLSPDISHLNQLFKLFSSNQSDEMWLLVLDYLVVPGDTISLFKIDHPAISRLNKNGSHVRQNAMKNGEFILMMDPFFFNAWIMSRRSEFPHLAACLINSFSKAAKKLNHLENQLPFHVTQDGKAMLGQKTISIEETLEQGAENYLARNFQAVDVKLLKDYYESNGWDLKTVQLEKLYAQISPTKDGGIAVWHRFDGFVFKKNEKKLGQKDMLFQQYLNIIPTALLDTLSPDARMFLDEFNTNKSSVPRLACNCNEIANNGQQLLGIFVNILVCHLNYLKKHYGLSAEANNYMTQQIELLQKSQSNTESDMIVMINDVVKNILYHSEHVTTERSRFAC